MKLKVPNVMLIISGTIDILFDILINNIDIILHSRKLRKMLGTLAVKR